MLRRIGLRRADVMQPAPALAAEITAAAPAIPAEVPLEPPSNRTWRRRITWKRVAARMDD